MMVNHLKSGMVTGGLEMERSGIILVLELKAKMARILNMFLLVPKLPWRLIYQQLLMLFL